MSSADCISSLHWPDLAIDKMMAWDRTKDKTPWHATLQGKSNLDDCAKLINLSSSRNRMSLWLDYNNNISNHVPGLICHRPGTEVSAFHILLLFLITSLQGKYLHYLGLRFKKKQKTSI